MNTTLRTGALALALFAGTALVAAPAMADHDDWKKKSWNKHGYKHGKKHYNYSYRGHNRNYGWNRGYSWKKRYYGPPRYGWYGYGWPYYYGGSGFSIIIR